MPPPSSSQQQRSSDMRVGQFSAASTEEWIALPHSETDSDDVSTKPTTISLPPGLNHSRESQNVQLHTMDHVCSTLSRQQWQALIAQMHDFANYQSFFTKLQVQARNLRGEVAHERKEYLWKRQFVCDSIRETTSHLSAIVDNVSFDNRLPVLLDQRQKIADDQRVLDEHTERLRQLEEQLSNVELEMQNHECYMADSASQATEAIRSLGLHGDAQVMKESLRTTQNSPIPRPIGASTPPVHATLQDYYDKAGERKVLQERLAELDYQHREDLSRRDLAEDQERPMRQTYEEFEDEYHRGRVHLKQALHRAISAEKAAHAACLKANLDPDVHEDVPKEGPHSIDRDISMGNWGGQPFFDLQHDPTTGLPLDPYDPYGRPFPMVAAADGGVLSSIAPDWIPQEHVQERIDSWMSKHEFQQPGGHVYDQNRKVFQFEEMMPEEHSTPAASPSFEAPTYVERHPFEEPPSRPPMVERRSSDSFVLVLRHRPGIHERTLDHIRSRYGTSQSSKTIIPKIAQAN